ncbi:MAG: M3 family oligoendopeptidase, partial [Chloroflexota bacterium]
KESIIVKKRYELTNWSLYDLLPETEGPVFDQLMQDLEVVVCKIESYRDQLSPAISGESFAELVQLIEKVAEYENRMSGYGGLWFAADTQSQEALGFMGRMHQLFADIHNRILFFSLWWKKLDDQIANRLMAANEKYRYFLESLRRFKPHTLSEPEEKVINLKNVNGADALVTLYDMITNKFVFKLTIDGEEKDLTREELSAFYRSTDPQLREAAYREINRVYANDGAVLGQIYIHLMRDWRNENLTLREFPEPVSVRNLRNDIPDPVVETLLDVSRKNTEIFKDYFALKAKWLGVDKLQRFDVYAPSRQVEVEYPYAEAVDLVLDTFSQFSPKLGRLAQEVFDTDHIDSEIRPGKEGGAFCAGMLPGVAPWVKVNYTSKARDVATLAHELGHAVHSSMAADHSILTFHSSLPLAETASVFSEMLLTDRLLSEEEDPAVRRSILASAVDDAYATVMRQAYFVIFERDAHRMIAEGKTANEISQMYYENLLEQFGSSVEVDEGFKWEWTAIPHFYATPFYCYAYSFGQLLVLALYQRYRQEGADFIPGYLRILAYGGSASPEYILSEAGVDMSDPDFWQGGFDVIRGMVEQLKDLS